LISIIIPCRGHAGQLRSCLAGVRRQQEAPPHEVIVVNSDADPAVAAVAAEFPGVRVVSDGSGLTPGGARNRGASEARGELLAFIDADCVAEPAWLAAGLEALGAGAQMVGGAVLDMRPLHPVAVSDNLLQFSDFLPWRPDGAATHIPTCNFMVRRDAFKEVGGFVEEWPLCEDGLFSTAARARWPQGIRFAKRMRVRHAGRATLPAFWEHQRRFGFYRGRVGTRLSRPIYQQWGRSRIFTVPVICVRLGHVMRRNAQWNPLAVLRVLALLPVILPGLAVWAGGFRTGCLEAAKEAR
jgi:glycosyltransferase involved in cell wall biosynthesis